MRRRNVELASVTGTYVATHAVLALDLPQEARALYELAHNLWWTWSPRASRLFTTIHRGSWAGYRTPLEVLQATDARSWESLLDDASFTSEMAAVIRDFEGYLDQDDTWFRRRYPDYDGGPVAYFSTEYGLDASLPIYSGGLGVLSGDHCKSASDLGVPLVAVGLLYRRGYFRQTIDADGLQQHSYTEADFAKAGLRPVASPTGGELTVEVPMPDRAVRAKVWTVRVGRVPLLLLDTDHSGNDAADRPITGFLYVRGREMRLAQEMVLGVGGARALAALGIEPAVWHLNEGHSALLQLERLRLAARQGSVEEAVEAVRRSTVFTTHTQVAAGHETFDRATSLRYLGPLLADAGIDAETAVALGAGHDGDDLNLTALALRTSGRVNGVSRLNARESTRLWKGLARDGDATVHAVTNGVHLPTWLGHEMGELVAPVLAAAVGEVPGLVGAISDADLWRAHRAQKALLGRFVRSRLRGQYARHGRSPDELRRLDDSFDEQALTLGFARRFATYKRANLLFRDLEAARELFSDARRPVQIVFAGKAHPADRPGQELVQEVFRLGQEEPFAGRVFFLEDYDLEVARRLVQGVDVWLNTPRRPLEACGTSGMKAAANGVVNCSILDGWWDEAYDGDNGFAIVGGRHDSEADQDAADAEALHAILTDEVVPRFYRRDDGLPADWLATMRCSIATAVAGFSSDRMVRDYTEQAYLSRASSGSSRPLPLESAS